MSHVLESAPTGRAKCRACGRHIAAGDIRFGERVPNPFADAADALTTHWFHPRCAAFTRPEPFLEGLAGAATVLLEDRDGLEREARLGLAHHRAARVVGAERAASGRATCRGCRDKIEKGAWRIVLTYYEDGRFTPAGYIHLRCAQPYLETTEILGRVRHFSPELTDADAADIATQLGSATSFPPGRTV
jgi:hypothetical protein